MTEDKQPHEIKYSARAYITLHNKYMRQKKREEELKKRFILLKKVVDLIWKILSQVGK